MAFNDLLSSPFLFSIAIIIILIGGIFAYVSYRMSEQDHKISSMLGLISTMAGELQFFRSKLSKKQDVEIESQPIRENFILNPNNLIIEPALISVSDEEDDDDEEDEDHEDEDEEDEDVDEDEDEDEDDEDDEDEDEDQDEEDDDEDEEKESLNFVNNEENNLEDIVDLEQSIFNLEDAIKNNDNIKSIHLEEPIDLNFANKENESMDELLTSDLKSISITDLEETNKKQDYKKMSINKLREVVVEKKLIMDASKLKKPDLLKLLGDE
jgi:hypothetical protein